jgi:hypothetical protein
MTYSEIGILVLVACSIAAPAQSKLSNRCTALKSATLTGVEVANSEAVPAGKTIAPPYPGASAIGPLPAHCRIDGTINRRKGSDGENFGIGFSIALPEPGSWNGDFMMQGGGGGNGVVAYPVGASYTGDKPALSRGFAVASTDSGHKAKTGSFDFTFMRDQQAYLDFAYMANAAVAGVAKQIIDRYYSKPAAYSYFVGCSTGGHDPVAAVSCGVQRDCLWRSGDADGAVEPRDCTMDSGGLQPGVP